MELRSSGTPVMVGGAMWRWLLQSEMLTNWVAGYLVALAGAVWDDAVWPAAGAGSYEVENIMSSGQGKFPLEVVTDNNLLRQRYESEELGGAEPVLSTPSALGVTDWDVAGVSVAGHVTYSALPKLNNYLRADGKVYSISAYPGLARRLGRVCNGLSAFATRSTTNDRSWVSVCWSPEQSIFVAVGSGGVGGRVMTSPDGITWTPRISPADNGWRCVCWSPELSLFVAVAETGTGNRVMTSPDGINWTLQNSPADNGWRCVCWSPERLLFVAVAYSGTGNRVMTSPDGIVWTLRASAADNVWRSVCWSPDLLMFVAVSSDGTGNRVMTSPDGISWTQRASAADNAWQSVCWSPELCMFVSVAYSGTGNRVMTAYGCTYNPITDFAVPKITPPAGCYAHIFAG